MAIRSSVFFEEETGMGNEEKYSICHERNLLDERLGRVFIEHEFSRQIAGTNDYHEGSREMEVAELLLEGGKPAEALLFEMRLIVYRGKA